MGGYFFLSVAQTLRGLPPGPPLPPRWTQGAPYLQNGLDLSRAHRVPHRALGIEVTMVVPRPLREPQRSRTHRPAAGQPPASGRRLCWRSGGTEHVALDGGGQGSTPGEWVLPSDP